MDARGRCRNPFEVVFVCTGNRARSPLAEVLFRKYAAGIDATATSFGTLGLEGVEALPTAVEAARELGVDLTAHASRPLELADLSRADLVVGFEPAHVSIAVVDGRASIAHTFLLGELLPLLELPIRYEDPCERARTAVSIADSRRVRTRPDAARAIADPYGLPAKAMRRTAEEIDRLVRALVPALFGAVP
jgi:protein-tyrosine-phosphatase